MVPFLVDAQVYKAYLKGGEAVAVKVQRPNCEEIIQMDIYILRRLSGAVNEVLRVINKDFDLALIVDEFGKLIYDEIDYLNEARNAERFKELYGSLDNVVVPRVYWKYTSSKVLHILVSAHRYMGSHTVNPSGACLVGACRRSVAFPADRSWYILLLTLFERSCADSDHRVDRRGPARVKLLG